MARALSAPLLAAITSGRVYPGLLVAMEWASGTTRFSTFADDRVFLGETFTGAGNLLGVGTVQETLDLRANGLSISLNGVNNTVLALALNERRQGKPVSVWIVFLDAAEVALDDPYLLFSGRVDVPKIRPGVAGATVAVQCENRLIDFMRPRRSRYTPEDQKARYPGDKGFDYVPKIQNRQLAWGAATVGLARRSLVPPPPPSADSGSAGGD